MDIVTNTASSILKLFVILAIGMIGMKKGIFTQEGNKKLTDLLLDIVSPILIFTSYQTPFSPAKLHSLLQVIALSFLSMGVAIFFSIIAVSKHAQSKDYLVDRMSLMYTNCGFIGLPLLQVMFGKEGVFLVTGYISVFQIICWSYGVVMLKGKVTGKDLLNILLNPNMIAIFIGLPCYVTGFTLPDIILAPMQQIAAMNTPLAMLVVGASLAMNSFKDLFLSARGYFITIMHNIVYPVLFLIFGRLLLAKLGWPNDIVWLTVLVSTACPIGSTSPMFALRFGRDNTYASALLGLSTLVCIGTIPAILFANGLISF